MIKFKNLHIENFLSLGRVDLDLSDDSGFILVDGENRRIEDAAASNGSGKTASFEAIIWALTGDTNRGYKDVVNRYQDEGCLVKLDFDFKDHAWSVERARSKKGTQDLHIWKDGKELEYKGLRDAEAVLAKELPELTMNFLGSTIILGQGLPQRFTNNTPAGRKAVLEELSNADYMITHIKENIKSRQDILSKDLRETEDDLLVCSTNIQAADKNREKLKFELDDLRGIDISKKRSELELLVEGGKKAKLAFDELQTRLAEVEEACLRASQDFSEVEKNFITEKSNVEQERLTNLSDLQKELSDKLLKETEELTPQIEAKKKELSEINEKLSHNRAIYEGGFCKLCGQKLQNISEDEIQSARKFVEDNLSLPNKLDIEIGELSKRKLNIGEEIKKEQKDREVYVNDYYKRRLKSIEDEFNENSKTLKETLLVNQKSLQAVKEEASMANENLIKLRSAYQIKKAEVDSYETNLSNKEREIANLEIEIKDYKDSESGLKAKKLDFENRLKAVKSFDTFASRDFRGILLEDIITQLDYNLHQYAEKVYGKPLTRFYQEGNTIGIQFDGKEYESLSGGEKQKLDVLIQLSLRDLIIQTSGIEANLVVFDEIFDALDQTGCESLLNVITELGLTVYSITHRKELNIPYDKRLVVVKEENGIAHLEIG